MHDIPPPARPVPHDDVIPFPHFDSEQPTYRHGHGWALLIGGEPVTVTATGDDRWMLTWSDGHQVERSITSDGGIVDEHLPPPAPAGI